MVGRSLTLMLALTNRQYADLSLDARIRYVSDSVEDILGYLPHEVRGKSCWEYFHPDQIPFAREIHGRGIQLDKAAVLNYCQIKHKDGTWVGCECVFTLVYDVLVATTSIYRRGPRSRRKTSTSFVACILADRCQNELWKLQAFDEYSHHHHETHDITCCHISQANSTRSRVRNYMSPEQLSS